jgi:hypothetical protein
MKRNYEAMCRRAIKLKDGTIEGKCGELDDLDEALNTHRTKHFIPLIVVLRCLLEDPTAQAKKMARHILKQATGTVEI